jgi:hypothetical protein
MNKVLRNILIGLGVLALAGGLVMAGVFLGRRIGFASGRFSPVIRMMNNFDKRLEAGRNGFGGGMMGSQRGYRSGMMGGYGTNSANITPLTLDEAYQSADQYLAKLNNTDLKIAEVMVFDNNAYVRVIEQSTGTGAFELLVDPFSQIASPEPGPNMMWNLKYAGFNHQQMMGGGRGMMGYFTSNATPEAVEPKLTVSSEQALQDAQKYLDTNLPGTTTAEDADPFYGYYTIDILKDGKTVGMLSVNGFNGQVFLHTWHGTFIEAKDY